MRLALSLTLFAAPVFAVSAIASEPKQDTPKDTPTEAKAEEKVEVAVEEEKRICRRVKLDMSSRRKEKVCKTADEWREFNQVR